MFIWRKTLDSGLIYALNADVIVFVYKQIWWATLSSLNSRVIHISMATTYTIVKVLIFTFSYYFFCIPGTHKSHGARWLLILCLMCNVHFHRKKNVTKRNIQETCKRDMGNRNLKTPNYFIVCIYTNNYTSTPNRL